MVIDFIQTKANAGMKYQASDLSGQIKLNVEIPLQFKAASAYMYRKSIPQYILHYDTFHSLKEIGIKDADKSWYPFTICNMQDIPIGRVFKRLPKRFSSYFYLQLELNGQSYQMYEIGLGKQGIKLPIFHNEKQIALIEKDVVTYDNKDTYQIYLEDENMLDIVTIFNTYYDYVRFGHYGEMVYKKKDVNYLYTTNKEVKEKWNPKFKEMYVE